MGFFQDMVLHLSRSKHKQIFGRQANRAARMTQLEEPTRLSVSKAFSSEENAQGKQAKKRAVGVLGVKVAPISPSDIPTQRAARRGGTPQP
ncbi:hypothetical protein Y1Q_0004833 [Alligator mississippiensis]|uniref:Uncharacterized protein n=1 Tax=Alligator mississippiensis TaxID=8496 RepID=A0A151NQS4_ALLMI|nr:hypothetical protein Y1Q_0004833 [Alligator mississippiensis]